MNQRSIIIIGVAVVLGLLAVYLANSWFSGVEERQQGAASEQELVTIAVASQELEFGSQLTDANVRLASWPASSVPAGAFQEIGPNLTGQVAIRPISRGEPILETRISSRASLSENLPLDMRAVSIPVNQVTGVAGFVLPGDVVDVMLTRDEVTSVLLENVMVLAIDRRTNEQETDPAVVDTATLQVDPISAQKLTLARQVGNLTLALRNVENQQIGPTPRVDLTDLGHRRTPAGGRSAASTPVVRPAMGASSQGDQSRSSTPRMAVVRGTEVSNYEVQRYGSR